MRLLIVQLSDIHFQATGNPVTQRLEQLGSAILAIHPHPEACLVLVTGDVANSGQDTEYKQAVLFFAALRTKLQAVFGDAHVRFEFIPGNHDCYLPEEQIKVRETLVTGSRSLLAEKRPDPGYIATLTSPQTAFTKFYEDMTGEALTGDALIYRMKGMLLGGKQIRIMAMNTALLSQRYEQPGTLYVPHALLERLDPKQGEYDATLCILHHPYNWYTPEFRQQLVRLIEDSAHIVFTGHEHQRDIHWSESAGGEETAYIEADALQDKNYPKTSGFNTLVLNFEDATQTYYHYRWKGDMYHPVVNGQVHRISLVRKSFHRFQVTAKFSPFLNDDDFGFTHPRKADLKLADFYAYPPLSVTSPTAEGNGSIAGSNVPAFLLAQTAVYIIGQERAGKTALLKMLYLHLLGSARIPVYLKADEVPQELGEALFTLIDKAVRAQYGDSSVEPYRQLKSVRRVVMIDDLPRLRFKNKQRLQECIGLLKGHFGLVVVTSSQFPDYTQFKAEVDESEPLFSKIVAIRELPPSSRAEIIDKWFRLGVPDPESAEAAIRRESLRERNVLSDLIRKRALPSLPYLVLGVLQIRQNKKEDLVDPGSFGYLFQRLVLDALSITETKPHVDRKEGILRRFAYALFREGLDGATKEVFDQAVAQYVSEVQIKVDSGAIFTDLIAGKVLKEVDGFITFRHHYFFHYFVARQLLDDVDSDDPSSARKVLQSMADRPLLAANRLTLMFFLFFKKRDPIIDYLIQRATQVFATEPLSDIASDAQFVDDTEGAMKKSRVDETIDVHAADAKNLESEDSAEERQLSTPLEVNEMYSESLSPALQLQFAYSHIELLGQVIRSFSGTLDGKKKQEILETVFRLGLRSIHVTLKNLAAFSDLFANQRSQVEDKEALTAIEGLFKRIIAFLARIHCDGAMLNLSRAVGVSDIEESYESALAVVGNTCATQLLEIAIKLDHSETFPFALLKTTSAQVAKESKLAATVLSDLVVRHTQLIPMERETLRRIASMLDLDTKKLIEAAGK